MELLPASLEALRPYLQFVIYRLEPSKSRPGKMEKIPIHPKHGYAWSPLDETIWLSADDAIEGAKQRPGHGVGFVFTDADPFCFLDIDECIDEHGTYSPLALSLIAAFPGAYFEVSQSRRGGHLDDRGAALGDFGHVAVAITL